MPLVIMAVHDVLRSVTHNQEGRASDARRSLRQPGTSCELKAMHLVDADRAPLELSGCR
jgi:hypothetical protein